MSSRKVTIQRIPAGRLDKFYTDSKRSIGSVMTRTGETAHGLTFEEVRKYMPGIVNSDPSDYNFRQRVDDYFRSLTLRPTLKTGLELEIGMDVSGEPINVTDYVHYKFALQNPKVAANPEMVRHGVTLFIAIDREKELADDHTKLEKRRNAYKEYIKLTDDTKKLAIVLTMLSGKLGYGIMEIRKADEREVLLKLEKYVQDNPEHFFDLVTDKNLATRAFIEDCISAGALNRVGTAILNGDQKLGSTTEEAIMFLADKANSEILVTLKARVAEYKKLG
jgi:hypothetical protein